MASARGGSGDAAALVVASRTEVEAMQEAFFGFAVRAFFEDVFNMGVFLIGDVIDEFERAAVKVCEESISRQRKGSRGAPAKAGPTDSNVHEEVAKGADTLWEVAMEAFEFVSTQMLAYNQRNTFAWPEGLTYAVPGGATGSGAGSHTMLYTATQEAELDTAIAVLEEKLAKERRRKRTLLWLQQMLHKRVPQAEDALKSLEAAVRTLDDGEAHLSDEAYQQFFDQAVRLNELCGRLSDASGAAAAAIATERARQPGEE